MEARETVEFGTRRRGLTLLLAAGLVVLVGCEEESSKKAPKKASKKATRVVSAPVRTVPVPTVSSKGAGALLGNASPASTAPSSREVREVIQRQTAGPISHGGSARFDERKWRKLMRDFWNEYETRRKRDVLAAHRKKVVPVSPAPSLAKAATVTPTTGILGMPGVAARAAETPALPRTEEERIWTAETGELQEYVDYQAKHERVDGDSGLRDFEADALRRAVAFYQGYSDEVARTSRFPVEADRAEIHAWHDLHQALGGEPLEPDAATAEQLKKLRVFVTRAAWNRRIAHVKHGA